MPITTLHRTIGVRVGDIQIGGGAPVAVGAVRLARYRYDASGGNADAVASTLLQVADVAIKASIQVQTGYHFMHIYFTVQSSSFFV